MPNRLADGRYSFDGTDYQVALTEPDKNVRAIKNSVKGLLPEPPWELRRGGTGGLGPAAGIVEIHAGGSDHYPVYSTGSNAPGQPAAAPQGFTIFPSWGYEMQVADPFSPPFFHAEV